MTLSDKQKRYIDLVHKIKNCHICEKIKMPTYIEGGECLLNDFHGIRDEETDVRNLDSLYVNRWNCWQGSLDAKIMLIGQDFGNVPELNEYPDSKFDQTIETKADAMKIWKSPTDANLYELFMKVFHINIAKKNDNLYFTNLACCYRKNKTTGSVNDTWFYICASNFMRELIEIIQPKVIIALGEKVFNALGYCAESEIRCLDCDDEKQMRKWKFSDIVESHDFVLRLFGKENMEIPVFPVYHTGSNSNINRPMEKQLKDWNRIKKYVEQD